jgi:hypothetical protein
MISADTLANYEDELPHETRVALADLPCQTPTPPVPHPGRHGEGSTTRYDLPGANLEVSINDWQPDTPRTMMKMS